MMGNMDWLRRNWPDLLIGIALVAVIGGIIATLISGGSFFPVGQGNRNAGQPAGGQPTVTTPAVTTPAVTTPSTSGATTVEPGDVGAEPTDAAATGTDTDGGISVLPPPGSPTTPVGSSTDTGSTPPATTAPATTTTPATSTQPPASGAGQVTSTPAAGSTGSATTALPGVSTQSTAPYRVSVGAFGSLENANRQADAFRAAGYPVFLGTQGSLNLVLVGPYDTETQARSVADRIRADAALNVPDPTVYVLDDADTAATVNTASEPSSAPATTVAPATTAPAATAPPSSTTTTPPPATTTTAAAGRYLQVGAYGSRDSSLPQRERVEALGFVVSEREEDGLIKLLIGPFDAGGLESAQARLQTAGVESFAR